MSKKHTKIHSLIIGGTRGAGKELVSKFVKNKHIVSVIGSRAPTEKMEGAQFYPLDLQNTKKISTTLKAILKKGGKLNNLIFFQRYRGSGDAWQGEFATSITATKEIIENLKDHFAELGTRSIVVVSSVAATFIAKEQPLSYHVGKAALNQLARFYAITLAPFKIRVNTVSCITILKQESRQFYEQNPELVNLYKKIIPLGRMSTSQDIAGVIDFLCSDSASFLTGQNIYIDGGLSLQWQESLARELTPLKNLVVTRRK